MRRLKPSLLKAFNFKELKLKITKVKTFSARDTEDLDKK